jgi:hypothetical protein
VHRNGIAGFKGQSHEIFDLWIFRQINTPGPTDSWVSNMDSYLRRYSTTKIANFRIYFTAMPWGSQDHLKLFLQYCCFNGCHKSRNIGVLITRYAKKLGSMLHSAESQLASAESQLIDHIQNCFYPLISEPSGIFEEKKRGSKIWWDCPFKLRYRCHFIWYTVDTTGNHITVTT